MAPTSSALESAARTAAATSDKLLVMLTTLPQESVEGLLGTLSAAFSAAFSNESVMVASADLPGDVAESFSKAYPNLELRSEATALAPSEAWVLTAADFVNLYKLAQQSDAGACLLLGPESATLSAAAIRDLAIALSSGADLATPHYDVGPRDGLVNSALLYPVSRAIFGVRARFPLAFDLGLSMRMASRMATVAQKFTALNQNDALVWPVAEAAAAGFTVAEVEAGPRTFPPPPAADLNALLGQVTSSLFTEVDTYAAFWQRSRVSPQTSRNGAKAALTGDAFPDVQPMLDAFRVAFTNLHEIWSLVLPPNSLLGLKRLSQMPPASFRMADSLWARIVYDFILAYRLRTINRGHLLGALTPL